MKKLSFIGLAVLCNNVIAAEQQRPLTAGEKSFAQIKREESEGFNLNRVIARHRERTDTLFQLEVPQMSPVVTDAKKMRTELAALKTGAIHILLTNVSAQFQGAPASHDKLLLQYKSSFEEMIGTIFTKGYISCVTPAITEVLLVNQSDPYNPKVTSLYNSALKKVYNEFKEKEELRRNQVQEQQQQARTSRPATAPASTTRTSAKKPKDNVEVGKDGKVRIITPWR